MLFLNDFEIDLAQRKAAEDFHRPNVGKAVLTLARLAEWANNNSDGWHSWPKPSRASQRLQSTVSQYYIGRSEHAPDADITASQLKALESPIRAFLTRQGVEHRAVFLND